MSKYIGSFKGTTVDRQIAAAMAVNVDPKAWERRQTRTKRNRKRLQVVISNLERNLADIYKRSRSESWVRSRLYRTVKFLLRQAYIDSYILGIRSTEAGLYPVQEVLRVDEKEWINSFCAHENRYLNKLIDDIITDSSRQSVEQRLRRYATTVNSIFDTARVLGTNPLTVIDWVKHRRDPCESCKLLLRYSPYTPLTLPTTPKAGATLCLDNCKCTLRFNRSDGIEVLEVSKRNLQKQTMLKKLNTIKR